MTRFMPCLLPPLPLSPAPLQLRGLFIAGWTSPVIDADYGINRSIVFDLARPPQTEDPPKDALCIIDPWNEQKEGDKIDVYLNDEIIAQGTVEKGGLNKRLFLSLPHEKITPTWGENFHFKLTPVGETGPSDESTPWRLRVKLDRPGGKDREPHNPGHSELKAPLPPQDVIDNGVDAGSAKNGFDLEIRHYPGRAAHDTIQLAWGSAFVYREITPQEASTTDSIFIRIDQQTILAAGDSARLLVHYMVFDLVWNYAEKYSSRTYVQVDAGAARLSEPIIKEASSGVIDLPTLGKQPVTIQVIARAPDFALNDTLNMTWIGTPVVGLPLENRQSKVIDNLPAVYAFEIPNAEIRALAGGSGDAFYILEKANGDPPLSSKHAFANVEGQVSALPAPTLIELIGDTLEPDQPFATVIIHAYPGMKGGDHLKLVWLGEKANNAGPYLHEEEHIVSDNEEDTDIVMFVLGEHIAVLTGGSLRLSYWVSNDNAVVYDVRESDFLDAKIQVIRAEIPAPMVVEAPENKLDPYIHTGSVTLRIGYLGTAKDDILTYYWHGNPGDGSTSDWVPISQASAGKQLDFTILRKYIEPNINNIVRIRYVVLEKLTGRYRYSGLLELVIGDLLGDLPEPMVIEASPADELDPINALAGATVEVRYESMDEPHRIHLNWLAPPGAGTSDDLELPGSANGSVLFTVPASVVGANINRNVMLGYEVTHKGFVFPSETLALKVLAFQDPDNQLPKPWMPQANNTTSVLNLATFTGNANVTVGRWPFIAAKQRIWLRLEGHSETGMLFPIPLLDGHELTANEAANGLSEVVLRTELERLGHNTPLTVVCKVGFSTETDEFYALAFPLTRYTFKSRHDWVMPEITSVKDSWGEVGEGENTLDTRVRLDGTATPDSSVQLYEGTVPVAILPVSIGGAWSHDMSSLSVKSYRLTVHALDGSGFISSPRTFSVEAANAPTITSLKDAWREIAHDGYTTHRQVTIKGQANARQNVRITGISVPPPQVPTDDSGGWTLTFSTLALQRYSVVAEALYGEGVPPSAPRSFTVTPVVNPTITSVRDSRGELNNGGSTTDNKVTLRGSGSAYQIVQILGTTTTAPEIRADGLGIWTLAELAVTPRGYSLTAKALYGDNVPISSPRTFTVVAPTPALNFNQSPVTLSGAAYILAGSAALPNFGAGTSVRHAATGGVGSHRYSSSNPAVAAVDGAGLVTVRRNGSTTITATDSATPPQSKSYTVTVTGVWLCHNLGGGHYQTIRSVAASRGLSVPDLGTLNAISAAYRGRWPWGGAYTWSSSVKNPFPPVYMYALTMPNGATWGLWDLNPIGTGLGIGR
ncbi:Ig-like domain-containing protein [Pseudomonas fluorescens]|uniref:Ig-like domain-containing protein n=1 Tax=Pseudomonas fluorescens TaxID=294 RepID=UPI00034ACC57|nr:Ig-like domain-containing protein [Pseudomonas fluorescens]